MREDSSRELVIANAIMKQLTARLRQACLAYLTTAVVTLVQDLGFHLSDFLKALAQYVLNESDTDPETELTRATVSSLLEMASQEAEQQGRQLP